MDPKLLAALIKFISARADLAAATPGTPERERYARMARLALEELTKAAKHGDVL